MPNIKKLAAGDLVYAGENLLMVTLVDPIRLFVYAKIESGETKEYQPWQIHVSAKKEEEVTRRRPPKRKVQPVPEPVAEETMDSMDNSKDAYFFKYVLRQDGLMVRIGDICKVFSLINALFLVTDIVGTKDFAFNVDLILVMLDECGVVNKVVQDFKLSIGIEHILSFVKLKKSSKVATFVSNLVFNSKSKLSLELDKNDVWYKAQYRKFTVGSLLRNNIRSNIKMLGSSAIVNLGPCDMVEDLRLFGLKACDKYRVKLAISDFYKLDSILGCKWDIKPEIEANPDSFFQFVHSIVIYIHKSDQLKAKFEYARSLFPLCDSYRAKCVESIAARSESFQNEAANVSVATSL